ncbi:MAG: alpha/beta fold hydrolase [Sphingomonadales bacterium]|nr:alpha/beta fold hydrolase [Sphingomonadales bacterium]
MTRAFTVSVAGGLLHGEARGPDAGDRIAFLHGMAGSAADWNRVWALMPDRLPLLRHDLRGFGRSLAEPGFAFSHADDVLALLDARGVARASLVGVSMGGAVALNFALNHPERVARLVLVSPAVVGWEWSDAWKTLWRAVSRAARAGDLATARALWWRHPMFARARESDAGPELRAEIEAYHGRQWFADDQRPELPDVERLPELACPTLLLSGTHDVADMRLIADVIAGSAPDVARRDFAAGHMLHLECPGAVAEAIAGFCA